MNNTIKENYQKQVDQAVKMLRNEIDKIRESDNPYYRDKEVQDYEISKKREELEKHVREIKNQFNQEIDTQIEVMEPLAAKSYFKPSETDKKLVDEFISDFLVDAKLGYTENDKLDAFDRFEQKLGYLDENGLSLVKKRLPELFDALGEEKTLQSKLRGLNATFKELKTSEQMELEGLREAKLNGVDQTYRRLRLIHPIYSDYKDNRYSRNK